MATIELPVLLQPENTYEIQVIHRGLSENFAVMFKSLPDGFRIDSGLPGSDEGLLDPEHAGPGWACTRFEIDANELHAGDDDDEDTALVYGDHYGSRICVSWTPEEAQQSIGHVSITTQMSSSAADFGRAVLYNPARNLERRLAANPDMAAVIEVVGKAHAFMLFDGAHLFNMLAGGSKSSTDWVVKIFGQDGQLHQYLTTMTVNRMDKGTVMVAGHTLRCFQAISGASFELNGKTYKIELECCGGDDAGLRAVAGAPSPVATAAAKFSQIPRQMLAMGADDSVMFRSFFTMTAGFIEQVWPAGTKPNEDRMRVMYGLAKDLPEIVRLYGRGIFENAPWHAILTNTRNLTSKLFLEALHLDGNDPELWVTHMKNCHGIECTFTKVKGRVDWSSNFNNGKIGRVFVRSNPLELFECAKCESPQQRIFAPGPQREHHIYIWTQLLTLLYSIATTLLGEKCTGICSAQPDRHAPCAGPSDRHSDGVDTFQIEIDTLMAFITAITGDPARLTSYSHQLKSHTADNLQKFRRFVDEMVQKVYESDLSEPEKARMRIEVSETFNFKGEERLEEKHIWKKQLHSLGGGNLLDAEAEIADLTNQLEGHELIAAASVARHSVHRRRKRSGKEFTWHEVRLEGKVRDTGWFRLGSDVRADELVFGTSANVRTRKMELALQFTREQLRAAPNDLEPVAQLCGAIEVTDQGVLTGSGAIYAAAANALQVVVPPNKTSLKLTGLKLLGLDGVAHDWEVTKPGSRGGAKAVVDFVLKQGRLSVAIKKPDGTAGSKQHDRLMCSFSDQNTFAIWREDAVDADAADATTALLHIIAFEPDVMYWSANAKAKDKWFALKTEQQSKLAANAVLNHVHYVLDVLNPASLADLLDVITADGDGGWELPGHPDQPPRRGNTLAAPEIAGLLTLVKADDVRLARGRRLDDRQRGKHLKQGEFDAEATASMMRMHSARARNAIARQRHGGLALAPCVCGLPAEDGGFRGTRCWACQFRKPCPFCGAECVPAPTGSLHGAGSPIEVVGEALHEECPGGKELLEQYKALMVALKVYEHHWVFGDEVDRQAQDSESGDDDDGEDGGEDGGGEVES